MTKEELKMTSKEALQRLENVLTWSGDLDIDTDLYNLWVDLACRTIEKDLDRLEKLEKENQELKQKVNHLNKVIEVMKNPSKLDCTHMFDNCKELKPLTEKKEHKMTSKEGLKLLETRCRFFAQDDDELQETYEAREAIQKDLELLEILKRHCDFSSPLSMDYFIEFFIYNSDEDFEKVKEWLTNENK